MNYYFAYGANMNYKTFLERCAGAKFVDVGILRGYRFIINARGVASVVPDECGSVFGILWKISKLHEATLDLYEGVEAKQYKKRHIDAVKVDDDNVITYRSLIYIATDNHRGKPRIPYLEDIVRCARYYRFPNDYIDYLQSLFKENKKHDHH